MTALDYATIAARFGLSTSDVITLEARINSSAATEPTVERANEAPVFGRFSVLPPGAVRWRTPVLETLVCAGEEYFPE